MNPAESSTYKVAYDQLLNEWHLTGPVGARGLLRFDTARSAAHHARWEASLQAGGVLEIWDRDGKLYKTEDLPAKDPGPYDKTGMPTG